jgi:hypothetical protein
VRSLAEASRHRATQFLESDLLVNLFIDQARRTALPGLHLTVQGGCV